MAFTSQLLHADAEVVQSAAALIKAHGLDPGGGAHGRAVAETLTRHAAGHRRRPARPVAPPVRSARAPAYRLHPRHRPAAGSARTRSRCSRRSRAGSVCGSVSGSSKAPPCATWSPRGIRADIQGPQAFAPRARALRRKDRRRPSARAFGGRHPSRGHRPIQTCLQHLEQDATQGHRIRSGLRPPGGAHPDSRLLRRLGQVHGLWRQVPEEFDDYIAKRVRAPSPPDRSGPTGRAPGLTEAPSVREPGPVLDFVGLDYLRPVFVIL